MALPTPVNGQITDAVTQGNVSVLASWTIAIGALFLLEAVLEFVKIRVTILTGQRVIYDVRKTLFHHIHRLPVRFFDKTPIGTLVTRVTSDVEALAELFSSGLDAICHDVLSLLLMMGLLYDPLIY